MCHQSVSLIARHFEENGIPTVIMGCARDIVEHAGVPRFWWSDFPLGHSGGKPFDTESQMQTLLGALALYGSATGPRTTQVSPQIWADDDAWKADFMDVSKLDEAAIAKLRASHEAVRATARAKQV